MNKSVVRFLLGLQREYEAIEPSVTIIVPAYNEEKCIADTIRSLLQQTYPVDRIVVVDDASTDGIVEISKGFDVEVVTTDMNKGSKARAINFALDSLDTDITIIVDADTVLDPRSVENVVTAFSDKNVGIACGSVIPRNPDTFWGRARLIEYLNAIAVVKSAQENLGSVLIASGCFFAIRTDLLKSNNGFDERTFAEDMDLTWVITEKGYKVRYVQGAIARSLEPVTWSVYSKQVTRWNHGFLQTMKVRGMNTFRHSFKLGLLSYYYIITGVLAPFVILYSLLVFGWLALILLLVWYILIIGLPAYVVGRRLNYQRTKLLVGILEAFVVQLPNIYLYHKALINEFLLKKTVTSWDKGH